MTPAPALVQFSTVSRNEWNSRFTKATSSYCFTPECAVSAVSTHIPHFIALCVEFVSWISQTSKQAVLPISSFHSSSLCQVYTIRNYKIYVRSSSIISSSFMSSNLKNNMRYRSLLLVQCQWSTKIRLYKCDWIFFDSRTDNTAVQVIVRKGVIVFF